MKAYFVRRPMPVSGFVLATLLVLGVSLWIGCGGTSGPQRYRLSGSVTHGGKPVPAGQIVFEPDASKSNSGPQGFAEVRDGKYDTTAEKGVGGGPYTVRVSGYDHASRSEDDPVKSLFPEYVTTFDFPKQDGTQDIDVPADWKGAP